MINLSTEKTQYCCSDNRFQKQKHLTKFQSPLFATITSMRKFADFTRPDPDLELRGGGGGGGLDLLALPAIFPSVISSFLPKIRRGGGAAPPGPSLDPPLKNQNLSLGFILKIFLKFR